MDILEWPVVKLSEISEVITKGTTPTTLGFNYVENGIRFIKIENISHNNKLLDNDEYAFISEDCNKALNRSVLQEGDILFSIAGALGRCASVEKEFLPANTNQALAIIRLKDKRLAKYVWMLLLSEKIKDQIASIKIGVAQYNLSLRQIGNIRIPLPPLLVQKEIVAELELYQKIIDGARQVVENYKPTIKIDPTWETVKLGEVLRLSSGRFLPKKERENGQYCVYGGNGITGYHTKYFVEAPTIVIGRVGEYCGTAHITSKKCWVTDNALMATDYYKEIDLIYLWISLNQLNLRQYAKVGGQPSISQSTVYERTIYLPPMEIQQKIVKSIDEEMKIVDQNKRLIEIFEQKISDKFAEVWGE